MTAPINHHIDITLYNGKIVRAAVVYLQPMVICSRELLSGALSWSSWR
jgi:hypothetical protein